MESIAAILKADPDLGEDLSEDELERARRPVVASVIRRPAGRWAVQADEFEPAANLGLLVIGGRLSREVTVGDYTSAELLGPGDVLQPWLRIGPERSVETDCTPRCGRWRIAGDA